MEAFSWLLISDLHLKTTAETWSQQVVLRDMARDIAARQKGFTRVSFILISGDLAFSGDAEEYKLVEFFLDDLRAIFGLERERVFFVPGNHDIRRKIQRLCHEGARRRFTSPQIVEEFLSIPLERQTLLQRLSGYLDLDSRFCAKHTRTFTDDGLSFFATFDVDGLPIGIAALNSAWLCGDDDDERQILVGDRPVIDLVEIIRTTEPRLVIGVLHHPPEWLRDFDQRMIEDRFLPECDFLHRGHLHEPNVRLVSQLSGRNCIVVAAGAGYAGREFDNSYSIITVNPAEAHCIVSAFLYDGRSGQFRASEPTTIGLRFRGDIPGTTADLDHAIAALGPETRTLSPYLASLLRGSTTEVPVRIGNSLLFAAAHLLSDEEDAALSRATRSFLKVRNLLLAFSVDKPLVERVLATKTAIVGYARHLSALAQEDDTLRQELERRVAHSAAICRSRASQDVSSPLRLLDSLITEEDWASLESFSRRYATSSNESIRRRAQTGIALALAHSDEPEKRREGKSLADSLAAHGDATPSDFSLAITLAHNSGDSEHAQTLLRSALARFQEGSAELFEIGYRIVTDTGDQTLKTHLDAAKGKDNHR